MWLKIWHNAWQYAWQNAKLKTCASKHRLKIWQIATHKTFFGTFFKNDALSGPSDSSKNEGMDQPP